MTKKRYAVSVQWGSFIHYFTGPMTSVKEDALRTAAGAVLLFRERYSYRAKERGAKPTVRVWELIEEVEVIPNANRKRNS